MASSTEKHGKLKIKILKLLPKLAKAVNFQNPPYSPSKPHASANKMMSIIPIEARRKPKHTTGQSFESQEPSSPKVSCMGKIKHQKNKSCKARKKLPSPARVPQLLGPPKKRVTVFRRVLSTCLDDYWQKNKIKKISNELPSLSQMKSLSSGRRDSFAEFGWLAQSEYWSSYSDEEGGERCEEEEGGGKDTIISFSAPLIGGMPSQPKKEVNIWKRRSMAPPRLLQLNT